MRPYADSNFFTRVYLALPKSEITVVLLSEAARAAAPPLPITWLHRLEVLNAMEQQVFVSKLQGQPRITFQQAAAAQASFREDLGQSDFLQRALLDQEKLATIFETISLRHTARHGFRVYDVIHVASALLLECDTFWSFDVKAARLAKLEGLKLPREIK